MFFAGEPGTEWEREYRQLLPMSPGSADSAKGGKKEIAPKSIYGKARAGYVQLGHQLFRLLSKRKDAGRAQGACAVPDEGARKEVVDAEYQQDRCKLTFYFVAQGILGASIYHGKNVLGGSGVARNTVPERL
ncbi:hypothetical protein B0H14DRAFT_2632875 [Mycena olivaceomarginata]|nr:hypothetical protein B0H14DRAFT_2632875 [Mycena olivaceomarginata]